MRYDLPHEEPTLKRVIPLDGAREDGRRTQGWWRGGCSMSNRGAEEKRHSQIFSRARRASKSAYRGADKIAPRVNFWYSFRHHETYSSSGCGLAIVPSKA